MVQIRSRGKSRSPTRGRGSGVSPFQVTIKAWKAGLLLFTLAYLQYMVLTSPELTSTTITNGLDAALSSSSQTREEMRRRTLSNNNSNDDEKTKTSKNPPGMIKGPGSSSEKTSIGSAKANSKTSSNNSEKVEKFEKGDATATTAAALSALSTLADKKRTAINETATIMSSPPPPSKNPHLVLHVGPPKTGTTSLQSMLHHYVPQLLTDGYYYAGDASTMMKDFRLCLNRIKKAGGSTGCWTDFVDSLEDHRKKGHNLILSNEIISWHVRKEPIFWKLVKEALKPWLPNLTVVVGYRHLHNFLPSTHYEVQKNQRWPSKVEKGKYVTPLTKFWREQFNRKDQLVGPMPTPASVMQQFRKAHYNVSVLDIETKEQISEFFCHILPNAPKTCAHHEELRRGTNGTLIPSLNKNDGGQVNYDALALVAFQRELLKDEQTRKYVRSKVKDFNEIQLKRGPNDFPLDCLNSTEELQFLHESLQHAHDMGFISVAMTNFVTKDFFKTKAKNKFCSINALAAFEQKEWYDFFHSAKKW